ncbi:MAG: hypothetical protein ACTHON_17970, partial [Humibacter sp.]
MADLDDLRRTAVGLPGSEERSTTGGAAWFVRGKLYAWDEPNKERLVAPPGDVARCSDDPARGRIPKRAPEPAGIFRSTGLRGLR